MNAVSARPIAVNTIATRNNRRSGHEVAALSRSSAWASEPDGKGFTTRIYLQPLAGPLAPARIGRRQSALGYDEKIVSVPKKMINVLYLTNNAGRASTTVATRG